MSTSIHPGQIATPEAPWLGLRSFTEDAQDYFFGRRAELEDLYERILDKPLTILFGQSGLGKSSLLQAALVPRLRAGGFLPVLVRLNHEADAPSPDEQMIERLKEALIAAESHEAVAALTIAIKDGATRAGWDPAAFLWLLFHDPTYGFIPRQGESGAPLPRPVFLVDQFEEIFTLGDRADRRAVSLAFRDALASLIENRPPASLRSRLEEDDELVERLVYQARHTRVLLSLREDFLHVLERWQRSMPSLMENRFELRMLSGPQAFDAVVRPGQLRPALPPIIPDEVGHAIVRFVAGVENDVPLAEIDAVPPLLSLVCAELNAQRVSSGEQQITRAQFEGHSDEILQSFYLRSFDLASYGGTLDGIPDADVALNAVKRLIEDRLLSPDGYRESIAFDTIARDLSKTTTPTAAKAVLDEIVERRLLTVEERGSVRRLELAHDVLTPIVRRSRDERQETEALAKARDDKQKAEALAENARLERNRLRRLAIVAACFALVAIIGSAIAIWKTWEAQKSAQSARESEAAASRNLASAIRIADTTVASTSSKLTTRSGLQKLRGDLLKEVVDSYTNLREQAPDDPRATAGFYRAQMEWLLLQDDLSPTLEGLSVIAKNYSNLLLVADGLIDDHELQIYVLNVGFRIFRAAQLQGSKDLQQHVIDDNIPRLERLAASHKNSLEITPVMARYYNARARLAKEPADKQTFWRKAIEALDEQHPGVLADGDTLRAFISPRVNLADNLLRSKKTDESKPLIDKLVATVRQAIATSPDSPAVNESAVWTFVTASDFYNTSEQRDVALTIAEDAVEIANDLVTRNPGVAKYVEVLADAHKTLAERLQNPTSPQFVAQQHIFHAIESANKWLAAARLRRTSEDTWDEAARAFAKVSSLLSQIESPDSEKYYRLRMELLTEANASANLDATVWSVMASVYSEYAAYLKERGQDKERYSIAVKGTQMIAERGQTAGWQDDENFQVCLTNTATAMEDAAEAAKSLPEVIKPLEAALRLLTKPVNRMRAAGISTLKRFHGKTLLAVEARDAALSEMQDLRALLAQWQENKQPHYYLQIEENALHQDFAMLYRLTGDEARERVELNAYVEGSRRILGAKIPAAAEDRSNSFALSSLRKLADEVASQKNRKKFVIPCDGKWGREGVEFFFIDYAPGEKPIADQIPAWEELGYTVPKEFLDSLSRLQKIAIENKVGFVDLCTYALNYGTDNLPPSVEIVKTANRLRAADTGKRDELRKQYGKLLAETIEKLKVRIGEAKAKQNTASLAEKVPLTRELAELYLDLSRMSRAVDRGAAIESLGFAYAASALFSSLSGDEEIAKRLRARIDQARTYLLDSENVEQQTPPPSDSASTATNKKQTTAQERLQAALDEIKNAEAAYAKFGTDQKKQKVVLAAAYNDAADSALYVQRWKDAETWARKSLELYPNPSAYGNLATALLFQGKFAQALKTFRAHWGQSLGNKTLGEATYDDFEQLAKAGITHPDIGRLRAVLPSPTPRPKKSTPPSAETGSTRRKWVPLQEKGAVILPLTAEEKERFKDEEIVLLLSGSNNSGDKIYSYLKLKLAKVQSLVIAVETGGTPDLSEYGEVIASGLGEPTAEVKARIEKEYRMINFPKDKKE